MTLEELETIINTLPVHNSWFFTRKEVKYLPKILKDSEILKGYVSGFMEGNTWLIAVTNERIIFLDRDIIVGLKQIEIPINKINSIIQHQGILFGDIEIYQGADKMVVENVLRKYINPFVQLVNDVIRESEIQDSINPSYDTNDIPAQIQKLSDLHQQGILTYEEFVNKKRELLNRM